MGIIQNYSELAKNNERKIVLEVAEAGLYAVQPKNFLPLSISLIGSRLTVTDKTFDLSQFERIFLLGFGKGSAEVAKYLEDLMGDRLTDGFVIDITSQDFKKIHYTPGTHPLPSDQNLQFTKQTIEKFQDHTEKDLFLIVVCGGGSAMMTLPHSLGVQELIALNESLLHSGATIQEINIVRKHLSQVQGGGLAKTLFPSSVISLICSDVPGNDLSTVASGPFVKDVSTVQDALDVLTKYDINLGSLPDHFKETPKEDQYFSKVHNIIILSNRTALEAMRKRANKLGIQAVIPSYNLQLDANEEGQQLVETLLPGAMILVGGESTVKVKGHGQGGRNQALVLAALPYLGVDTTIASIDSDGWDNSTFAGAIGDQLTLAEAAKLGLDLSTFQNNNDSFNFFTQVKDGIITNRLPANVTDLTIVYKRK